jgi:glycosyltransferase involved in cell wall biosynthesis
MQDDLTIAILIPCLNEENSIGRVIQAFKTACPQAEIYVYDNASTDSTVKVAEENGAVVRQENIRGKGNVVRRMFSDIDASVYVLVDGDDTYDADSVNTMIETLKTSHSDMIIGNRIEQHEDAYRFSHRFGNRFLTSIVRYLFGQQSFDLLSGYRVMSRRFVKSFPAISTGFEIETELTIHALSLRIPMLQIDTPYSQRVEDSFSKLNTIRDGARIFSIILLLTKEERPFMFFSVLCGLLFCLSLGLGIPVTLEWIETGLVPRFPTAILSASIMLLAFLSLTTGLVLDSVARGRREIKRLHYLHQPWLG